MQSGFLPCAFVSFVGKKQPLDFGSPSEQYVVRRHVAGGHNGELAAQ